MLTKTTRILLLTFFFFLLYALVLNTDLRAQPTWEHPEYEVEIDINEDSTFDVTERVTIVFNGLLNGYRRDITLHDADRATFCASNGDATCGGFDLLAFGDFKIIDGEKQSNEDFNTYIVTEEDGTRFYRIEQRLYDSETNVTDDEYTFEFSYKIFGGIQELINSGGDSVPFFYWNMLPEDTNSQIEEARFIINLPDSVDFEDENLQLFSVNQQRYSYRYSSNANAILIQGEDIDFADPATVSYEFKDGELRAPGSLELDLSPSILTNVYIDDFRVDSGFGNSFDFIPEGSHTIRAERFGYEDFETNVTVSSGETTQLEISLDPEFRMNIIIFLTLAANVVGVVGVFWAIRKVQKNYNEKGKDREMPKTIVPEFSPPDRVRPYLLGSIKDEKVDQQDITGTIIDLAYRGFIKIKEINKGKEYELTRMGGKKGEKLTAIEAKLMKALFKTDTDFVEQFKQVFGKGNKNMNFMDLFDFGNWGVGLPAGKAGGGKREMDSEKQETGDEHVGATVSRPESKDNKAKAIGKTVNTKKLGVTFVKELERIKSDIYEEMVERKYFDKSPKSVRETYLGIGIGLLIFGLVTSIGLSVGVTFLIGTITPFLLFIAAVVAGLIYIVIHSRMPAKTAEGSKIYADILGFKMYMETAERYRVQNLTPETFEKYLSYAIVFGIEKKWADKFKDIYKDMQPDWYEGTGDVLFNAWVLSNLSRSFTNATNSTITSVARNSGVSGGGWSGGGSFGGFSGGGGGGGSSGGW